MEHEPMKIRTAITFIYSLLPVCIFILATGCRQQQSNTHPDSGLKDVADFPVGCAINLRHLPSSFEFRASSFQHPTHLPERKRKSGIQDELDLLFIEDHGAKWDHQNRSNIEIGLFPGKRKWDGKVQRT